MNYYYVGGSNDRIHGIAYFVEKVPVNLLPKSGLVENWHTMQMILKKDVEGFNIKTKGEFADYQANERAVHLCSTKLRDIIDRTKSEYDEIQWLPTIVRKEDTHEEREYYIIHFPNPEDLLDKEKTIYGAYNTVIGPVISGKLAAKHNVFNFLGRKLSAFVSEKVKREIQAAKCTGVIFERAAATD